MPSEIVGLFATPLARVRRLLDAATIDSLVARFSGQAEQRNAGSDKLTHTSLLTPEGDALLEQTSSLVLPHVAEFGQLLFGEPLKWSVKELWVNVLDKGGRQALHNHANSFVSGILYLTTCHASANTVFAKAPGGLDFVLNNTNARTKLGPYSADKWVAPDPAPGDLLLFPSYLLHEVPLNQGSRRVSLAFNAIPDRLDSWGYTLTLAR